MQPAVAEPPARLRQFTQPVTDNVLIGFFDRHVGEAAARKRHNRTGPAYAHDLTPYTVQLVS